MKDSKPSTRSRIAIMFAAWGWLAAWSWASVRSGCLVGAVFLLGLWGAMMASTYEWSLLKRLGFVAHYLKAGGVLSRLLVRRTLPFVWSALKTLPAALILYTVSLSFTPHEWLLLAADVLFLAGVLAAMDRLLGGEVTSAYARPLARVWAHRINALVLWVALVTLSFYTPHSDYRGLAWESVAQTAAAQVEAGCDVVAVLGRIDQVGESLSWWAAQNYLEGLASGEELLVAWLAFLAAFGVSFLVAWSYSRVLVGVLSRPGRIELPRPLSSSTHPPQGPDA